MGEQEDVGGEIIEKIIDKVGEKTLCFVFFPYFCTLKTLKLNK